MSNTSARLSILNKIKKALEQPTPLPFPAAEGKAFPFQPLQQNIVALFTEQFEVLQGKLIFCAKNSELEHKFSELCLQNNWTKIFNQEDQLSAAFPSCKWYDDIANCDASVTTCELLVARTGSVVLSSTLNGRIPSVYAPIHICIGYTSALVYDIKDALIAMQEKYNDKLPSSISFASGPSRTADIEKTLVVGVHGPKEVYCLLVDDAQLH